MATTALKPREITRFVEYLEREARGRSNAKTARHLSSVLGFDDRKIRQIANAATGNGHLVCADNAGYYVPSSHREVNETIGRLRSQALEMNSRAHVLARIAKRVFSPTPVLIQEPLFGQEPAAA